MGSLVGHVAPGFGFLVIGLWHLLNHLRLHFLHPRSYTALTWFPAPKFRYLELLSIMGGCTASISMELFVGPRRHQPLDLDGTIPSDHLHNFEHSNISMTFFIYAFFSIILDILQPPAQYSLTCMLGAIGFAQEFLFFHLHSTDYSGLAGQYHWLLQIVILLSLVTTLLSIGYPKSFLINYVRSLCIFFQGVWLNVIGIMLYTSEFVPKGCVLYLDEGQLLSVKCHTEEALQRGKSLINIEFSWYVMGVTIFGICLYLAVYRMFPAKVEYQFLAKFDEDQESQEDDVEDLKRDKLGEPTSYLAVGKPF